MKAAVAQAEARLTQMRTQTLPTARQALERARLNADNKRKQLERARELTPKGYLSQSDLDDAELALQLAQSDLKTAQLQVAASEPGGSDYVLAEATLNQARANLSAAASKLNYSRIEAPLKGVLIARNVERGDVVQPGKALMVLSPAGDTQLVVQVDEKNLRFLRVGEPAIASADAYPDRKFAATVAYINPAIDADRGSVEVKLNVPTMPAFLAQDMTVSVDIEVARRANALVLAAEAVHENGGETPWVMKVAGGRSRRQPVKLGARGVGRVEILQGLQAGDEAIPTSVSGIADGQRVRARPRT
jgi:HlyD family secretion protein